MAVIVMVRMESIQKGLLSCYTRVMKTLPGLRPHRIGLRDYFVISLEDQGLAFAISN